MRRDAASAGALPEGLTGQAPSSHLWHHLPKLESRKADYQKKDRLADGEDFGAMFLSA